MGTDIRGPDYTKAAVRAKRDARRLRCRAIPFLQRRLERAQVIRIHDGNFLRLLDVGAARTGICRIGDQSSSGSGTTSICSGPKPSEWETGVPSRSRQDFSTQAPPHSSIS
ncbi:hypothetical protein D3C83_62240 [compost metagenome]